MFATFSISMNLGFFVFAPSMSRKNSLTSPDLSPSIPTLLPAILKSWQGKPPANISTLPIFCSVVTSEENFAFGYLFFNTL